MGGTKGLSHHIKGDDTLGEGTVYNTINPCTSFTTLEVILPIECGNMEMEYGIWKLWPRGHRGQ